MAGPLKIHCLMHVPYEGPAVIADWAAGKKHQLYFTRFYDNDPLPDPAEPSMLVIMGGPMNVFDYHVHPWMQEEIEWVGEFIHAGRPALGICLGAQVIAACLDAEVFPGNQKEIGWHSVEFLPALGDYRIWKDLPGTRKVFHWHGDTFHIPRGATRIASSKAFPNQGFIYRSNVLALQFHLESTPRSVRDLVENCRLDLVPGPFVQTEQEILGETRHFQSNQLLMFQLLDYLSVRVT